MTTQVAVINKLGVALATDSAASIYGGRKVFHANKLFSLSKYHPVGIMVYGNAEFFGIPWETIIKMYRKSQGNNPRDTLDQYTQGFISFLDNFAQEDGSALSYWKRVLTYYFVSKMFKTLAANHTDIEGVLKNILTHLKTLENSVDVPFRQIKRDFSAVFKDVLNSVKNSCQKTHPNLIWSNNVDKIFIDLCCYLLQKEVELSHSGIVIAGFGELDIFPSISWFNVDGRVCGKSRLWGKTLNLVQSHDEGMVFAFAQDDMIQNYMEGIHPSVKENISQTGRIALSTVKQQITAIIDTAKVSKKKKAELVKNVLNSTETGFLAIYNAFERTSQQMSVETCRAVTHLPPQELAEMAQSFVKLTCTRRRVSSRAETVGGPVDVAVITKGDGLVWIERKHYFEQAQNLQFVQNYINR